MLDLGFKKGIGNHLSPPTKLDFPNTFKTLLSCLRLVKCFSNAGTIVLYLKIIELVVIPAMIFDGSVCF